jgi:hypothetical protein
VARQAVGLSALLLRRALDGRPPRGRQHGRQCENGKQDQRGMDGREQGHGHSETNDPAARREERHVHVIEHEHLVAQHGEAIEKLRALLVGDRGDRCLEAGDMRLERDGDPVAEAPLHACAQGHQEPRCRRRRGQANRRRAQHAGLVFEQPFPKEHEPQRKQRIGQRGQLREHERRQHQPWLVAEAEPAEPPHRRQGGRQRIDRRAGRAHAFSRGRHTPRLPRLRRG